MNPLMEIIGDADVPLMPADKVLVVDHVLTKLKRANLTTNVMPEIAELEDLKYRLTTFPYFC